MLINMEVRCAHLAHDPPSQRQYANGQKEYSWLLYYFDENLTISGASFCSSDEPRNFFNNFNFEFAILWLNKCYYKYFLYIKWLKYITTRSKERFQQLIVNIKERVRRVPYLSVGGKHLFTTYEVVVVPLWVADEKVVIYYKSVILHCQQESWTLNVSQGTDCTGI